MARLRATLTTYKRTGLYLAAGLLLIVAAAIPLGQRTLAEVAQYDAYADSVADTAALVTEPNNAVGAPNNASANLAGVGASLTLDMGAGEEGTQTLRLYLGQVNAQANVAVAFLDGSKAVIASETRQLGISLSSQTQNFAYNWTTYGKAYQFVRISSTLGAGVSVDAIEALGYIGSTPTQDTDGDGVPDRNDSTPLVPNPVQGNSTDNQPPRTSKPGGTSTGASNQVNNPPATDNDKDGDGMADDWEAAHGLDPTKDDAGEDPDKDDLTNLTEYQIDSDPQKYDTDGDGMPDGWEHKHGLDVKMNDADGDPDGDYLTNLGEYRHGTDPNKADDLSKLFGKNCTLAGLSWWSWLLIAALVLAAFWAGTKASKKPTAKTTKRKK